MKHLKYLAATMLASGLYASVTSHAQLWVPPPTVYTNTSGIYDMTFSTEFGITSGGFCQPGDASCVGTYQTGTAYFSTDPNRLNVGTGVIDPFIRIQVTNQNTVQDPAVNGANCGGSSSDHCVEFGYNTNNAVGTKNDTQFQEKDAQGSGSNNDGWNHTIDKSTVQTVTIDGKQYYTFLLDINELTGGKDGGTASDRYLSLDQLRFFTNSGPDAEGYCTDGTAITSLGGPGAAVYDPSKHSLDVSQNTTCTTKPDGYLNSPQPGALKSVFDLDMDGTGTLNDKSILLDYSLNHGSGLGADLFVAVEADLFTGDKIYLFSSFGEIGTIAQGDTRTAVNGGGLLKPGEYWQSDGFEEWASIKGQLPIPATLALVAVGLLALGGIRRMRVSPRFA